jgi:hypothetical protein
MPNLLDSLRQTRAEARAAGDELLTRAAAEERDPTPDELAEYQAHVVAEREAADAMEQERDRQLAEVRAMATRGRTPTLTREAAETARAFRAAIFSKSPAPIEVFAQDLADEWPDDVPEPVMGRAGRVRVHTRDTLKSTATQALGVDVYGRIVQHMVETSSIMRAGATVITTDTGEDLVVPRVDRLRHLGHHRRGREHHRERPGPLHRNPQGVQVRQLLRGQPGAGQRLPDQPPRLPGPPSGPLPRPRHGRLRR